jgi:3-oxoacyl-[acyl-carrier protein] reductase
MKNVALVTGASRGIGRAIAAQLSREGWAVCINYLERTDAAESLLEELRAEGWEAMIYRADVADRAQVAAMVRAVERELGPVKLLVNNAGISHQALFQDTNDAAWARILGVNLTGSRNAVMEVMGNMISEKRGCIVNISSMWGLRGASCEVAYAATKAAVVGLTKSLALELAPSGIRVNCVAPGVIETDMCATVDPEILAGMAEESCLGRNGTPMDVAKAMEYLCNAEFITGHILSVNGGYVI